MVLSFPSNMQSCYKEIGMEWESPSAISGPDPDFFPNPCCFKFTILWRTPCELDLVLYPPLMNGGWWGATQLDRRKKKNALKQRLLWNHVTGEELVKVLMMPFKALPALGPLFTRWPHLPLLSHLLCLKYAKPTPTLYKLFSLPWTAFPEIFIEFTSLPHLSLCSIKTLCWTSGTVR